MTRTAPILPDAGARIEKVRALLAELSVQHQDGLDNQARTTGYHHERMRLHPNTDGNAQLIVSPDEVDDGSDLPTYPEQLLVYESDSDFTRWRTPHFGFFGMPSAFGEPPQS